jgi:tetratricopeptide (TPR) repeat protein
LIVLYSKQQRYKEAIALARQDLSIYNGLDGSDGWQEESTIVGNLANSLLNDGSLDEGEKLVKQAIQLEWGIGDYSVDPGGRAMMHSLGCIASKKGNLPEAEQIFVDILKGWEGRLPPEHHQVLEIKHELSIVYQLQNRSTDAEQLFLAIIKEQETMYEVNASILADWKYELVEIYWRQQRFRDAEKSQRKVVDMLHRYLPVADPICLEHLLVLAQICKSRRHWNDVEEILSGKLNMFKKVFGAMNYTIPAYQTLIESLYMQKRWKEADKLAQDLLELIHNFEHLHVAKRWVTSLRLGILVKSFCWVQATRYILSNILLLREQFLHDLFFCWHNKRLFLETHVVFVLSLLLFLIVALFVGRSDVYFSSSK